MKNNEIAACLRRRGVRLAAIGPSTGFAVASCEDSWEISAIATKPNPKDLIEAILVSDLSYARARSYARVLEIVLSGLLIVPALVRGYSRATC